jgi:hypothetical protein
VGTTAGLRCQAPHLNQAFIGAAGAAAPCEVPAGPHRRLVITGAAPDIRDPVNRHGPCYWSTTDSLLQLDRPASPVLLAAMCLGAYGAAVLSIHPPEALP